MNFFKQPTPRRFNHRYIYVDERKERLDKIKQRAERLVKHDSDQDFNHQDFQQQWKAALRSDEKKNAKGSLKLFSLQHLMIILVVLLVIYILLANL